jgi:hypothetical protein
MANYYVASSGSNSNTGDVTHPWLTIAHALSASSAGDVIHLNGGDTFTENVIVTASRTITSYGTGSGTIAGGTSTALVIQDCDGVLIEQIYCTMSSTANSSPIYTGVVHILNTDGTRRTAGVTIDSCDISGGPSGITASCPSGNTGGWNGLTITNNLVHDCSEFGIYTHEDLAGSAHMHYSNVLISGNLVHDITGNGNVNGASGVGIVLGNADSSAATCVISLNEVHTSGYLATQPFGPGGIFPIFSDGVIVKQNVVHNIFVSSALIDGIGIDIDLGCTNCIVEYNFTYSNQGAGYLIFDAGNGNVFRFNISVNDGTVLGGQAAVRLEGTGTCVFHNNTIVTWGEYPALACTAAHTVGKKVYNNIFSSRKGSPTLVLGTLDSTFGLEGNAYQAGSGLFSVSVGGTVYTSLSSMATAISRETGHGFTSTTNFLTPRPIPSPAPTALAALTAYNLVTGSSLLAAGLDLNTLYSINPGTKDFNGNTLASPYSVGACDPAVAAATSYQAEVLTDSPLVWWRMSESAGTALADQMLSGSDGVYTSSTLNQASLLPSGEGASVSFDGTSSYANFLSGFSVSYQPTALTVSGWIKPQSIIGSHSIVGEWSTSGEGLAFIVEQTGSEILFSMTLANVSFLFGTTVGAGLTVGVDHFIAFVWAGSNSFDAYIDGSPVTVSITSANTPGSVGINDVTIGRRDPAETSTPNYFDGDISEIALFPTALTSTRLAAQFSAATSPPPPPPPTTYNKDAVAGFIFSPAPFLVDVERDVSAVAGFSFHATPSFVSTRALSATAGFKLHPSVVGPTDNIYNVAAASIIKLHPSTSVYIPVSHTVTASAGFSFSDSVAGHNNHISVTASTGLALRPIPSQRATVTVVATASNRMAFSASDQVSGRLRAYTVSASNVVAIGAHGDSAVARIIHADAQSGLAVRAQSVAAASVIRNVTAATGLALSNNGANEGVRVVHATTGFSLSSTVGNARSISVAATSGFSLAVMPVANRDFNVTAIVSFEIQGPGDSQDKFYQDSASDRFVFTATSHASVGYHEAIASLGFGSHATALIELPSGGGVPGGDANSGLRTAVLSGISGKYPFSYAETPSGLVLLANGVDPMVRWDGLSGSAGNAGVAPPTTPIALAGAGVGVLTGLRAAYCRFVDGLGNYSVLSPISNLVNLGRDQGIDRITNDAGSGLITINSPSHKLITGEWIVIQDVTGLPVVNGTYQVVVPDSDNFELIGVLSTTGSWLGGGSWTWGCQQVVYQSVPVPIDPRVTRRQILRNLDGSLDTLYVDIDTPDLVTGVFSSSISDDTLSARESVPLFTADNVPFAMRYSVPPNHKPIVASFQGAVFAAGETSYSEGCVVPLFGQQTIQGIGTSWPASFAGRLLYISGANHAYEIASVNTSTQIATLANAITDPLPKWCQYAIRPAPAERKLIYFSEPGLFEAWPPWNAIAIPEDSDDVVSLMAGLTGYLFVIEQRQIYRWVIDGPPQSGHLFQSANRGVINHRCWVIVEQTAYMLDEAGIHGFDGQDSKPISGPIQSMFQPDGVDSGLAVDWSSDRTLWHASHDPTRETIRWFVPMIGHVPLVHAICYHYRLARWWIEEFPSPITSSTTGDIGYKRALAGTTARRVLVLSEGALDLTEDSQTGSLSGAITSATETTLTDSLASFTANLEGSPVSITSGTGLGQQAIVASNTSTTLEIVQPWTIQPDASSTYQIAGVNWSWKSGWFELSEDESSNPRDIKLSYQPTVSPSSIDLEVFFDHSDDATVWGRDNHDDGIVQVQGSSVVQIGTQALPQRRGSAIFRNAGQNETNAYMNHYVSVLLSGVQATEAIRVFQVIINGATQGE